MARRAVRLSRRARGGIVRFRESEHRRDAGGKFADKPGAGDDAPATQQKKQPKGVRHQLMRQAGWSEYSKLQTKEQKKWGKDWVADYIKKNPDSDADEMLAAFKGARHERGYLKEGEPPGLAPILRASQPAPATTAVGRQVSGLSEVTEDHYLAMAKRSAKPTAQEAVALRRYSGQAGTGLGSGAGGEGFSERMNRALRLGGDTAEFDEVASGLDSFIAKSSLPTAAKLYRGVGGDYVQQLRSLKQGDTIVDRGFSSTSYSRQIAEGIGDTWADEDELFAVMQISAPKGARVGLVGEATGFPDEMEALLGRGSRLRFDREEDGVMYFDLLD